MTHLYTPSGKGLSLMTQSDNINSAVQQISTVTKHIKLYSNNPIHEAIDRIINSAACLDEGDDYMGLASLELKEAADDLFKLACESLIQSQRKRERFFNESKTN
jgi:hypothetical protein